MSYDVWLFAPTYACISTKLSLYLVNKALSLNNILVFSFHAYRTRQMSMNGGTKNVIEKNNEFPGLEDDVRVARLWAGTVLCVRAKGHFRSCLQRRNMYGNSSR